jgi:uncharacterized membrane protein HdeD (DUF308 family)
MSKHSELVASLAGPMLIATAGFLLLNRKHMPEMAQQISADWVSVLLSGVLMLAAGLAIVRVHNVWEASWRVLVTLIGWLAVLGGAARMLYPRQIAGLASDAMQHTTGIAVGAVFLLVLGTFLTLKGYRLLD